MQACTIRTPSFLVITGYYKTPANPLSKSSRRCCERRTDCPDPGTLRLLDCGKLTIVWRLGGEWIGDAYGSTLYLYCTVSRNWASFRVESSRLAPTKESLNMNY